MCRRLGRATGGEVVNFEKSTERVVDFGLRCAGCGYDLVGFADPKCPRCGKLDPTKVAGSGEVAEVGSRRSGVWIWVGVVLLVMIVALLVGAIFY